jgi:uncharacterized protein
MANPVVHFEVVGKDGERLRRFYGDLFEWEIDANNPMEYGMVAAADGGIAGGVGQAPQGDGHLTFYVQVPDIEAALAKAESFGGRTVMPRTEMEMVTFAHVADPEGHVVGLVEA